MTQRLSKFLMETDRIKTTGTVAEFSDPDIERDQNEYCVIGAMGCELGLIKNEEDARYYDYEVENLDSILWQWGITQESRDRPYIKLEFDQITSHLSLGFDMPYAYLFASNDNDLKHILFTLNDRTDLSFYQIGQIVKAYEDAGIIKYIWEINPDQYVDP